jgi:hypothetical protein
MLCIRANTFNSSELLTATGWCFALKKNKANAKSFKPAVGRDWNYATKAGKDRL